MSATITLTSSALSQSRIAASSTASGINVPVDLPGRLDSTSIIPPSQTDLPIPRGCSTNSFQNIPNAFPACALQAGGNISVIPVLNECCNGAPRVLYRNDCHAFCEARNQTVLALHDCFRDGVRRRNGNIGSINILCNRAGVSYSSLLPANTEDPATRVLPTATTTTPSGNAAAGGAAGVSAALVVRDQRLLSAGAWATVLVLAVSGLASLAV